VDRIKAQLDEAGFRDTESHRVQAIFKYNDRKSIVDFLLRDIPHMKQLLEGAPEDGIEKLKKEMVEEMARLDPNEPGQMTGIALVAAGRK
jgi:hypothetical protein